MTSRHIVLAASGAVAASALGIQGAGAQIVPGNRATCKPPMARPSCAAIDVMDSQEVDGGVGNVLSIINSAFMSQRVGSGIGNVLGSTGSVLSAQVVLSGSGNVLTMSGDSTDTQGVGSGTGNSLTMTGSGASIQQVISGSGNSVTMTGGGFALQTVTGSGNRVVGSGFLDDTVIGSGNLVRDTGTSGECTTSLTVLPLSTNTQCTGLGPTPLINVVTVLGNGNAVTAGGRGDTVTLGSLAKPVTGNSVTVLADHVTLILTGSHDALTVPVADAGDTFTCNGDNLTSLTQCVIGP